MLDAKAFWEAVNQHRIDKGFTIAQMSAQTGVLRAAWDRMRKGGGTADSANLLSLGAWAGLDIEDFRILRDRKDD